MTIRFWIRVNAKLSADPEVQQFALTILPKLPAWLATRAACGLLVTLWGRVAEERENGDLNGVPDTGLEDWAGWQGKHGVFGAEFRKRFVDDRGFIALWQEYQGKLIERRVKDRKRKRGDTSAGLPQEIPQDFHNHSSGNPQPNGNGNSPDSGSYEPEGQERAPVALAPEGARSAPKVNGGIPGAPPLADDAERARYSRRLVEKCEAELAADPDAAFELEQAARTHLGLPQRKTLTEAQTRIVRSEMHERMRVNLDLPSFDDWQSKKHQVIA